MSIFYEVASSVGGYFESHHDHEANSVELKIITHGSDELGYKRPVYAELKRENNPFHDYPYWRIELLLQIEPDQANYVAQVAGAPRLLPVKCKNTSSRDGSVTLTESTRVFFW